MVEATFVTHFPIPPIYPYLLFTPGYLKPHCTYKIKWAVLLVLVLGLLASCRHESGQEYSRYMYRRLDTHDHMCLHSNDVSASFCRGKCESTALHKIFC